MIMDILKPPFDLKLHLTAVSKITRMQNCNHKDFTRTDLYAIMLPSSDFSVAH